MNESKVVVPKLRFQEFSDTWEQRKLKEICKISTGFPFNSSEFEIEGEYLVITNGNIQLEKNIVDYSFGNRINVKSNDLKKYIINENDILVTMDGTVGRTAMASNNLAILAQRVGRLSDSKNQNYLYYLLNAATFFDDMKSLSHGGTIKHISLFEIGDFEAMISLNNKEQLLIGEFFRKMDNLLALHQRKHNKLVQIKSSLLEKMFPKDHFDVPEIRFKGFNDAWNRCKVKNICSISTGRSNTQDQVDDGQYPFYIRSDIPVRSNRYLYDEEAVITIGDGNIGKVFHYVNGKFDLHQRCYKMSNFKDIEGKYFYYFFSIKFYERAMSMTAKATVDSVRLEMISDMEIKYPKSSLEQTKISNILSNIDHLITLYKHKVDQLQNIKKSLLKNMFL